MRSATSRLFERHTDDVYGWAYRLLGSHHDALDVVQDVYLKWARQCTRRTPDQPRGWLRRVTMNRTIDLIRSRREVRSVPETYTPPATADDPIHSETDRAMLREDIAAALDRLTEVQRSVLVAKVYDDMTFARIASELGMAVTTAKTHYLRALRVVRDRLRQRWGKENA